MSAPSLVNRTGRCTVSAPSLCTEQGGVQSVHRACVQNRAVYSQCTEPGVQNRAVYSQRTEPGVHAEQDGVQSAYRAWCTCRTGRCTVSVPSLVYMQNRTVYSQRTEPGVHAEQDGVQSVHRAWCTEQGGVQSVHRARCLEKDGYICSLHDLSYR